MPRTGRPKGIPKTGGRKKGQATRYQSVREYLDSIGYNPFETLQCIATGELPCNVCRGKGKTRYQSGMSEDKTFERVCQSCYGSGFERINPADRSRASSELCKYVQPQLKQIEVAGPNGGPVQSTHTVRYVEAPGKENG